MDKYMYITYVQEPTEAGKGHWMPGTGITNDWAARQVLGTQFTSSARTGSALKH